MHDLHEANRILKLVLEYAVKNKLKQVSRIVLNLGEIMEHGVVIEPENLKFNIQMLARGGMAEKAEIEIRPSKKSGWELTEIVGEEHTNER